jgi:LysR family transcriptional regulator, regulator for genes of the gallate degradation pathway
MDIWQCNLRHLRAALEVTRLGSINAAAQAVNLTQPAITQALAKLENQLGINLFDRSPIGMSPTKAARLFAPRIAAALDYIASPRVTMSQLRAFIVLSSEGSYATAAQRSGIAQPSLHRAVSDLSLALGRVLMERRGRGLTMTIAGRKTARAFRLAYAELDAGLADIEALKGHETGKIAIGAMPLSRARLLPDAVATFHNLYPEVEIKITEGSHAELIEPLRDGVLDLMIGALREGGIGDDVEQLPLFKDRPVVIARAGHPLSQRKLQLNSAEDVSELAHYPWIIAAPGTPLRVQWERMFTEAALPVPPVPIECGSVITIRQILIKSDFLTLLSPDQVAVELEAGWLTQICDAPEGFIRTIGITTRTGWTPTGLQKTFLKIVKGMDGSANASDR